MTYCCGVESASFVVSSNLLRRPLETTLELHAEISTKQEDNLWFKVNQELDLTVIAFMASQINLEEPEQSHLVSSSALKDDNFLVFEFLCNKKFPCFSLHKAAISLFYHHCEQLHQLKSRIDSSKPLIVTGHALGDPLLLFSLCGYLQKPFHEALYGIQAFSMWPLSGTLFPVETRSTVSDPYDQGFHIHQYSDILQNLHHKAICKAFTLQPQNMALSDSLEASILIQLEALGVSQIQQNVVEKLKLQAITLQQKKDLDPSKRLNDMKMYMANLEWYKKYAKAEETGMYDMYKKHRNEGDQDIVWWKRSSHFTGQKWLRRQR
ncbi:hypothetical protein K1719_040018 [Acacia pycnantha]|nr:hypothetical protein K1719_040018 [Acacia pycnantha]